MKSPSKARLAAVLLAAAGLTVVVVELVSGVDEEPPVVINGEHEFGFNEDAEPSALPLQASLGMPIRRLTVPWSGVEPAEDAWDWVQADLKYDALLENDLQPLLVANGVPCWAHPAVACDPSTQAPPDRSFEPAWREFVRRVVRRYPQAVGIEIWNEPNLRSAFAPAADPAHFASLLEQAQNAAKAADPTMPVVSGGLFASTVSGPEGLADTEFLAGIYEAGAGGAIDAIGAHPYPVAAGSDHYDLSGMEASIQRLRQVRDDAGFSATPIWITEMGVSTQSAPSAPVGATDDEQAIDLVAMVRMVQAAPDLPVALIHRLVDVPADPVTGVGGIESGFGVFRADGTPKPAACLLSAALGGSLSCG